MSAQQEPLSDADRAAFEGFAAASPFEYRNFSRFGEDESWPGDYIVRELSIMWEAWRAGKAAGRASAEAERVDVPREPTQEMLRCAYEACDDFIDEHGDGEASNLDDGQWNEMMADVWRAMHDTAIRAAKGST